MRKLQIAQGFENIQTTYDQPSITWTQECAKFSLNENDPTTGQLTVWQDGVAPEQIFTETNGLERKINQFLLAMQVMDNARMRKKDESAIKYFAKDGQEFGDLKSFPQIAMVDMILKHERGESYAHISFGLPTFTVECSMTSSPVSLPATLPQASLELERLIGIFTSAESFFGPYLVEHQLRNYFLIMEELCDEKTGMGISKPDFYNNLEIIRNFVSHSRCDRKLTMPYIEKNFPEAMVDEYGKKYAQFDRTKNSHIEFIRTYRNEAYSWVKKRLADLSRPVTKA
jgi:hypothetical protein